MLRLLLQVWILFILLSSCATLNQNEIKQSQHQLIEQKQLLPMLDFYGERIDIIRNKTDVRGGGSDEGTEDMPYHDAGFYLGNGLFYDLNGNLCLLPLNPFFDLDSNFTLSKKEKSGIINGEFKFVKNDSLISITKESGIGFTKNYEIQTSDSLIIFTKGKLMKMEFYNKPNGSYFYKRTLSNEDIQKIKGGYVIEKMLSKDFYKINGNKVSLANQILVVFRDNMIEVYKQGWSKPQLKFQMIVNSNEIIFYNQKYRGYKLFNQNNQLCVYKNKKLQIIYEKEN
jgi:hypothetical protein